MGNVYFHLLLSHVPVMGMVFGIMLFITSKIMDSHKMKIAAFGFFILIGLSVLPVYFTGEAAEESVEHLPWASETLIEQHEQWASAAATGAGIMGALAVYGLIATRRTKNIPAWLFWGFLLITVATAGLIARTANLGGQIRHTEIRADTRITETHYNTSNDSRRPFVRDERDDDDDDD